MRSMVLKIWQTGSRDVSQFMLTGRVPCEESAGLLSLRNK